MSSRKIAGAAMVEFLLVTPLLLLLGLGVVQAGLVFHAKSALNFALQEAARSGTVNHGSMESVRNGLLRGLVPFMGGGGNPEEIATTLGEVTEEFALGTAQGWIRVNQLSPMPESFTDWEEDATDESGNAIREIPNANLAVLRCTRAPNSGITGMRTSTACGANGERIGADSLQTLADANLLKLQMTYGVRLVVPFVNRIVGRALAMANGCIAPERQQVGPLDLGTPAVGTPNAIACAAYNARDASGNPEPRIPISLSLTVRMQSTPRSVNGSGWFTVAGRGRDAQTDGVQLGNGEVDPASNFAPIPVAQLNPNGVSAADDDLDDKDNGSVRFGADTDWRANLAGGGNSGTGGGSRGNGSGGAVGSEPEEPPLCTPGTTSPAPEESTGFLGQVWNELSKLAGEALEFVKGFWTGIKQQIGDLVDLITDPVETARGIYQLALAFIDDPGGTIRKIGNAIGKDISTLVNCGAYDRGRLLGENISPAFMLKLANKLARFGRGGLDRALHDTRREVGGCASFGPETLVRTPNGLVPIEQIKSGDRVLSRNDRNFNDAAQQVTTVFGRSVTSYRMLTTERDSYRITDEHPLWVQGKGWTEAKDIEDVDVIASTDGDVLVIHNERVDEPLQVFNFSVAETPSYFVGESGVWAHNAPCSIRHHTSTGNNPELNNPAPNTRHYVDGRHIFQTDDLGRTTSVTSTINAENIGEGLRNCYRQGRAGGCDRRRSDDGGHLIATDLGGPGEAINLVAQNRTLNRGAWRVMEGRWANLALQGRTVKVTVEPIYSGNNRRPTEFSVSYSVDGVNQGGVVIPND